MSIQIWYKWLPFTLTKQCQAVVLIFMLSFKLPFPPFSPDLNAVIYLCLFMCWGLKWKGLIYESDQFRIQVDRIFFMGMLISQLLVQSSVYCVSEVMLHLYKLLKVSFFILILYWGIVDEQCCVSFRCTAKWFSYTYTCIYSFSVLQFLMPFTTPSTVFCTW